MRPKCTHEEVHVIRSYHAGKRARRSDQRYTALARATHRQTARDRIARHSGIAAYEQVLVQTGDRGQPPLDLPCCQADLTILDTHHLPTPPPLSLPILA